MDDSLFVGLSLSVVGFFSIFLGRRRRAAEKEPAKKEGISEGVGWVFVVCGAIITLCTSLLGLWNRR